jgi:hypothetical protein
MQKTYANNHRQSRRITLVILAKARIQVVPCAGGADLHASHVGTNWILAFARMTMVMPRDCQRLFA